uniref:Uncharacterized protein n=1 Tax=Arundo donax TaxID=35708 RepID=A0A0A9HSS6_ARUDO
MLMSDCREWSSVTDLLYDYSISAVFPEVAINQPMFV